VDDPVVIREVIIEDLPHILRHRRLMFEEMGYSDSAALDAMQASSETYFRFAVGDGSYRGWLAEIKSKVVSGGGIVISAWPGLPSSPLSRRAMILNMYTERAFRRRGIARTLMTTMMNWLQQEGFCNVSLHASQFGRPLYESLGFRPTNELRLELSKKDPDNRSACCGGLSLAHRHNNDATCGHKEPRPFSIRKATLADAESILTCLAAAFETYRNEYTPEGFRDTVLTRNTIRRRLSSMCVFVAVYADKIVGTIGCNTVSAREGHLRGMAVWPEWQGSGVAQALLQAAETELRNRQCKRVTLDTTEPLKRAVRFYEKNGFSASDRVSDFFGMRLYEYVKPL
jgi:GNAT superfamily N-acetyltransferase